MFRREKNINNYLFSRISFKNIFAFYHNACTNYQNILEEYEYLMASSTNLNFNNYKFTVNPLRLEWYAGHDYLHRNSLKSQACQFSLKF